MQVKTSFSRLETTLSAFQGQSAPAIKQTSTGNMLLCLAQGPYMAEEVIEPQTSLSPKSGFPSLCNRAPFACFVKSTIDIGGRFCRQCNIAIICVKSNKVRSKILKLKNVCRVSRAGNNNLKVFAAQIIRILYGVLF